MAVPTQTDADKAGIAIMCQMTPEGVYMTQRGSILEGMGTGDPNGEITAPKGSEWTDVSNGNKYRNTDGAKTWAAYN
jgi:hypothetical protein